MNWNKAIKQIEKAMVDGAVVSIIYHRKWMKNDSHCMTVESIVDYQYDGQICKAINLYTGGISDQINEGSHIIDEVLVDHFFSANKKAFIINGTGVVFWQEAGTVFCKVDEMGADTYCCGIKPMPTSDEEALELAETAWIWQKGGDIHGRKKKSTCKSFNEV